MGTNSLERFLGGSPRRVIVRLLLISLAIGFILYTFDLRPDALIQRLVTALRRLVDYLAQFGLDTLWSIGIYIAYGAVIVVPIWLLSRLWSMRRNQ